MTASHAPITFMSQEEASRLFGGSYDGQCARCGSSVDWVDCNGCGGDGCHEVDDDDGTGVETCYLCGGEGSWPVCISSPEWCEANPLEGRDGIARSTVEWFPVPEENM